MNSLELYIKDIKKALDNNLYYAALALSLTIPDICSKAMYPDLKGREAYINWYQEYIGQYDKCPSVEGREDMPYLTGEAFYNLRCAILHEGRNNIEDRDLKTISLDEFVLLLEDKNYMDSYCDMASIEGIGENKKITMEVHIRNICNKIIMVVEGLIEQKELDLSKIPTINVRDYGAELEKHINFQYQLKRRLIEPKTNYEPIYKYCSIDTAVSILNNNCVMLNHPKNFNDPFEVLFDIKESDEKKCLDLIYTYYIFQAINDILSNKDIPMNFGRKLAVNFYKAMYKLFKTGVVKTGLYDVSDMMLKLSNTFVSMIPEEERLKAKEEFSKNVLKKVKSIRSEILVSCFSKKYDSTLMWSHYGDKHKGVCIEFERPDDFYDVSYQKMREKFNLIGSTKIALAYMLSGNEINPSDERLARIISKPILTKSKDWEYEAEVRCVFTRSGKEELRMIDYDKYLYFMPTKIRKVYLGVNITPEDKRTIIDLCEKFKFDYIEMKLSDDEYKLEIK